MSDGMPEAESPAAVVLALRDALRKNGMSKGD